MDLKLFFKCLFSPVLYSIHRGPSSNVGKYDPNDWEKWGDNFITSCVFFRALTIYTSPVLVFVMARRGYFTLGGALYLAKISIGIGVLVGVSYCLRSYGRIFNSKYKDFIEDLDTAKANYSGENKQKLRSYDFEFSAWPVDYECKRRVRAVPKRSWSSILSPCGLLSYLVMHSVGIRLIYPGSIPFINYLMGSFLIQGRHRLIVNERGQRNKLKTEDGNFIDTMFLDRRRDSTRENGGTLVICSEGNAGFYEIGIMATPVEGHFSVLGWNHPGFGGSTGLPYVDQEENAVDAVMQFALNELGFKPESVVLFGWSIGGYSTSYAAMNYPDVKAVVVDASFDDLLPLAVPRMPMFLEPVVKQSIRLQANLDVARKLTSYPGPVLLVRRSKDEVICIEPDDLSTNRGNHLLHRLLSFRYPNLFSQASEEALAEWLAVTGQNQTAVVNKYRITEERCKQLLNSYFSFNDQTFPVQIGDGLDQDLKNQLLIYLASKYFVDFDSTHCTILPLNLFNVPVLPTGE